MMKITKKNVVAQKSKSNIIHGTDGDDSMTIHHDMKVYGKGAGNLIYLYDGADNLRIGGKMSAQGGYNTILGDNGQKNITIKCGMQATKSGVNEILLADKIAHFTAEHYLTIGAVKASHKGKNIISTGDGDDHIAFTGYFSASYDGQNIITLGDGGKNLKFTKGMEASHGGTNIVDMGVGNQDVIFGGNLSAGHKSKNQIVSKGGNVFLHVKCNLEAKGVNEIQLGQGGNEVVIKGDVTAHNKGQNNLISEGESNFLVRGAMKTHHGTNRIETGIYDDDITIQNGMMAHGGVNSLSTGDGNDAVFVKGHIKADKHGRNIVDLGGGNDVLYLYATVGCGDLSFDAGDGYDILSLSADNAHKFNSQYKVWFTDMYSTSLLENIHIEEVRIDIDRNFQLDKIDWLTKMINQYNGDHMQGIAISLALDQRGAKIDLGDVFTSRDETSISIIDLGGKNTNELRIHDTLASNGYDGSELRINGNSHDSVGIDGIWSNTGGFVHDNENYYHVWENIQGESILIQDGIDIHVY